MEKGSYTTSATVRIESRPKRRHSIRLLGLLAIGLIVWLPRSGWISWPQAAPPQDIISKSSGWYDFKAQPYLDYHDCYPWDDDDKFQCALLELPMDYWNGTTNATVSIAVIKKPAVVPITHPQYGGPILFNPGGPGGSGVGFLAGSADGFRELLDWEDGKYFDYMSFDPRGVGESRPSLQCFSDPMVEQIWNIRIVEQGIYSASDAAFGRMWSIANAMLGSCSLPRDGEADIRKYATTASVATDMIEIIEREAEWREKEAERILNEGRSCRQAVVQVPETLKHKKGEEKLKYWGFSYGTYLGNTFAAMYPNRIDRLIVDGVVDAYDYEKALWLDNMADTEKDLDLLYYHCARVGYPTCALANETGKTTEPGVKQRTLDILQSLYHNPLPIIDEEGPEVVTLTDIKMMTLSLLYSPIAGFPFLANILADIEKGDGRILLPYLRILHSVYCPSGSCSDQKAAKVGFPGTAMVQQDATVLIACTDGQDQSWVTKEEFGEHIANLTRLSPSVGEIWSILRLQCINYHIRPVHRFKGPWVGNTSHPILEIGNTADPVTPGRYAKKMAKGFEGAVALIQDSPGHCSLAAPSLCTLNYIKLYFQTGVLPPPDTVCQADVVPFGPTPDDTRVLDAETLRLIELQAGISKALYASGGSILQNGVVWGPPNAAIFQRVVDHSSSSK